MLRTDKLLWAINYVNVEDYLRGVVPSEMSPATDIAALKAQAIVCRSYAVFHAIKNAERLYHLTRTSQAYNGIDAESEQTDKAIKSTAGKVLYYKKKLLLSYCCSSCGGHTEYPPNIWDTDYEYPRPVRCPYCKGSKNFLWSARFSSYELEKKLKPLDVHHIYAIKPYKKSKISGRITELKIYHKGGNVIRSGYFRMKKADGDIVFKGRGWGHGAGLCQMGAIKMAKLGKNYKSILRYYFPSTRIRRFKF